MNAGIYPSVNEVQALWACDLIAGKKKEGTLGLPRKHIFRKRLSSLLISLSSFLF